MRGIFLQQGLNLCLLHSKWIVYHWATSGKHLGKPLKCNVLFIIHSMKLEHPMFSPLRGGHKDEQGSVILSRSALSTLTFTILYTLIPAWQLRKLGLNCGQEHGIPALGLWASYLWKSQFPKSKRGNSDIYLLWVWRLSVVKSSKISYKDILQSTGNMANIL